MNSSLFSSLSGTGWSTPDKLESAAESSNGDRISILKTPPRRQIRTQSVAKSLFVGLAFFFTVSLLAGASLPDPYARKPESPSYFARAVSSTRKAIARRAISIGRSMDPDSLLESAPTRGYIKKALDRSRLQLKDQDYQRSEMQQFYEAEIHRLSDLLYEEDKMMKEVLGDDFDGTVDSSRLSRMVG